jgi:YjjG family noncanonical pyrimidine nucleotidase
VYATVLFDLDHMLLDSDASERLAFAATMAGADASDVADELFPTYTAINRAMWAAVERGELTPLDVKARRFEDFVAQTGLDADPTEMAAAFVHGLGAHGDLYPGARELLMAVRPYARTALVTNGIGEVQRARIARLDLAPFFDVVSISGELGVAKPGPEIFDHTFAELSIDDRGDAVMIGDSLTSDIAGGSIAGIDTIWFNRHGSVPGEVVPTHEVRSIDEIVAVLGVA